MSALKNDTPWPPVFNTIYTMAERHRMALIDFALAHPSHCDLVNSFPVAALRLAEQVGPPEARGEALWHLSNGAPLKSIAKALDLPKWTRRILPEAAGVPLPRALSYTTECPVMLSLGRRLPPTPSMQKNWLTSLSRVLDYEDPALSRWLIRRAPLASGFVAPLIDMAAAWKFYSDNPRLEAARHLPESWSANASWSEAMAVMHCWLRDVAVETLWTGSDLTDTPERPVCLDGYTITPITTQDSLEREADRMDNCLRTYWLMVVTRTAHLFSIAGPRSSRAIFDVRCVDGAPAILQIKGPGNKRVSPRLASVAKAWVSAGMPGAAVPVSQPRSLESCSGAWRQIWRPFLDAHKASGTFSATSVKFPRVGLLHPELSVLEPA